MICLLISLWMVAMREDYFGKSLQNNEGKIERIGKFKFLKVSGYVTLIGMQNAGVNSSTPVTCI